MKFSVIMPCQILDQELFNLTQTAVLSLKGAWYYNPLIGGEVIIIDSSSDNTPKIAESLGARVVSVPKRGVGRAYMDAMPHIRGKYVIMGDADCTYDFREIKLFISNSVNVLFSPRF